MRYRNVFLLLNIKVLKAAATVITAAANSPGTLGLTKEKIPIKLIFSQQSA